MSSMRWAAGARRFRKLRDLAMPTAERLVQLVRDKVTGRQVAIRVRVALAPDPGTHGVSIEAHCMARPRGDRLPGSAWQTPSS